MTSAARAEAQQFSEGEKHARLAVVFLRDMHPGGPWALTAIVPDGPIETRTFTDAESARRWIQTHDGAANLYWVPSALLGSVASKPKKTDVKEVRFLFVDVDPRDGEPLDSEGHRITKRLTTDRPKGLPEPTAIIDSGNGRQAFWALKEPIQIGGDLRRAADAERYLLQLALLLEGDVSVAECSHLMRLPHTMNLPNKAKAAKGRISCRARVLEKDVTRVHDLSCFRQAAERVSKAAAVAGVDVNVGAEPRRLETIDELDKWGVTDRVKIICVQGSHPEQPKSGDNSRSAWLHDACCQLVRAKVPDVVIYSVITDPDFAISASVLDKPNSLAYALRQILRAKETVAADEAEFQTNEKGVTYPNQHNIRVALAKLGVRLRHDQFADRLLIEGLPGHGPTLQDEAIARLYLQTDARFAFKPPKDFFWMVVEDEARQHGFHPVKDYLDGLEWDGTPRVDTWLSTYGRAESSEYTRAVGALVLIAAVRRIRQPGCKFDEVLVLKSPQGKGKSTAISTLLPNSEWFSDDLPIGAESQAVIERTQGKWIIEAAELKGIRRKGEDVVKAFLSRAADKARMAYGRITKEALRQFIIIGTTNDQKFLQDATGNRRWWPVDVERFDLDALKRDRDQLWAEAAQREGAGESIRLDPSLYAVAAEHQEANRVEDPLVDLLANALGDMQGKILSADLWDLLKTSGGLPEQNANNRVGEAMKELGWRRDKLRFGSKNPERCYLRGDKSSAKRIVVVRERDGRARAAIEHDGQEGVPF